MKHTSAKHTKGPWIAGTELGITTVNSKCKVFGKKSPFYLIIDGVEHDEAKANAQLIASAPKMLETLETIYELANDPEATHEALRDMVATLAAQAISKARGE